MRFSILNYATLTGHLLFWLRLEAALWRYTVIIKLHPPLKDYHIETYREDILVGRSFTNQIPRLNLPLGHRRLRHVEVRVHASYIRVNDHEHE